MIIKFRNKYIYVIRLLKLLNIFENLPKASPTMLNKMATFIITRNLTFGPVLSSLLCRVLYSAIRCSLEISAFFLNHISYQFDFYPYQSPLVNLKVD